MEDAQSTPDGASIDELGLSVDRSPMVVAAIGLHEAFTAYLAAGFTETQALTIIALMARG